MVAARSTSGWLTCRGRGPYRQHRRAILSCQPQAGQPGETVETFWRRRSCGKISCGHQRTYVDLQPRDETRPVLDRVDVFGGAAPRARQQILPDPWRGFALSGSDRDGHEHSLDSAVLVAELIPGFLRGLRGAAVVSGAREQSSRTGCGIPVVFKSDP